MIAGLAEADALARLERLRLAVAGHPWQLLIGDLPVTVSIGVAGAGTRPATADVLGAADRYLYTAKRSGRNRLCGQVNPNDGALGADPGPELRALG